MGRKAVRDWITNEEAAAILGISRHYFFKNYCQRLPLVNSQCVGHVWLHYLPDVLKLKERRARDPEVAKHKPKKTREKLTPLSAETIAALHEANTAADKPEGAEN